MSNDKQTTAVRQFINDTLKGKAKETEYYLALECQQIEDAYKEAVCHILCEEVCPIAECNAAWEYYEDKFTQ